MPPAAWLGEFAKRFAGTKYADFPERIVSWGTVAPVIVTVFRSNCSQRKTYHRSLRECAIPSPSLRADIIFRILLLVLRLWRVAERQRDRDWCRNLDRAVNGRPRGVLALPLPLCASAGSVGNRLCSLYSRLCMIGRSGSWRAPSKSTVKSRCRFKQFSTYPTRRSATMRYQTHSKALVMRW
jgi:hypothetical protein